jgi:hypothetical protein
MQLHAGRVLNSLGGRESSICPGRPADLTRHRSHRDGHGSPKGSSLPLVPVRVAVVVLIGGPWRREEFIGTGT